MSSLSNIAAATEARQPFPAPTKAASEEDARDERRRRVAAAATVLPRKRAERWGVVILDRPAARRFCVGSVAELDIDVLEELARALGTSTQCIKMETLRAEEFAALFEHAYLSGKAAQVQEEVAAARQETRWSSESAESVSQAAYFLPSEAVGVEDLTDLEEYQRNVTRPPAELTTLELVRVMLWEFIRAKASDLHVEIGSTHGHIRLRADGLLFTKWSGIPREKMKMIANSLCSMAGCEPAAMQFKPLNSVIKLRVSKQGAVSEVELRFASTPSVPLPEVVLRSQSDVIDRLDRVGLLPIQHEQIHRALDEPQGIFLVTGPVGSGKTNTLLGCCSYLQASGTRKIMESGDPIEVYSDFRTQIPITKHATWMDIFHSKLRMNPDTMYLGELRSKETVSVALEAALTGHLVLSTFHTVNVQTTFTRLFKMGIARDLLADGLNAILSQRLVRVLCTACRRVDDERMRAMISPERAERGLRIYRPVGCAECFGTGFKGRTAVAEILLMTDEIRDNIVAGMEGKEVVSRAVREGHMRSMQQVARQKIFMGVTSFKEVHRVMKLAVEGVMSDDASGPSPVLDSAADMADAAFEMTSVE